MNKTDFTAELDLLVASYPNAFPTDPKERIAIAAIWYDHFSHIPKELFAKATRCCREHERFLSIASLRESIIRVAGIPCAFEIRRQLYEEIENSTEIIHPIARRIYNALNLKWIDSELTDFAFEREYARAREWWIEKIMQPENVGLLTGSLKLEEYHG